MKISIGSDHRGFEAKERVKALLHELGATVVDRGSKSRDACDYPDFGFQVADDVAAGRAQWGMLFCASGIGMSITANKVRGIRAALCHDEVTAQFARRHNDANVLCVPADLIGDHVLQRIVRSWVQTDFEGGRHARRVQKILDYEAAHTRLAVEEPAPAPAAVSHAAAKQP